MFRFIHEQVRTLFDNGKRHIRCIYWTSELSLEPYYHRSNGASCKVCASKKRPQAKLQSLSNEEAMAIFLRRLAYSVRYDDLYDTFYRSEFMLSIIFNGMTK